MARGAKDEDEDVVVEVSHRDALVETIESLEQRGFQPVLIVFRDERGEIEALTRGVDLTEFTKWLATRWVPSSHDVLRDRRRGH